jgi:glycosyltransferase involved in cell wall biosynthesis
VETRLRQVLALGGIEATVLAPVPFFPFSHSIFGRYGVFARAPRQEKRHGIQVLHPRCPVLPRMNFLTPYFLYRTALRTLRGLNRQGVRFDVIDAHYFYPDGVAAAMLGRKLNLPVVITGRGTDLTLIPRDPSARRKVLWAAQEASASVTVCEDLRRHLLGLGADSERTLVLRNGVDLELFSPGDRNAARAAYGLNRFTLLSVGSLIPRKGHHLAIDALVDLPDCDLLIAGSGPMRGDLELRALRAGVSDRLRFLGEVPHADLPSLYRTADVLVLASEREGWANVLLEAMACGTPVVATRVNGTIEVVRSPAAGVLMSERSVPALVSALEMLRCNSPARAETRAYACRFGWEPTARANKALLASAALAGRTGRHDRELLTAARIFAAADRANC